MSTDAVIYTAMGVVLVLRSYVILSRSTHDGDRSLTGRAARFVGVNTLLVGIGMLVVALLDGVGPYWLPPLAGAGYLFVVEILGGLLAPSPPDA